MKENPTSIKIRTTINFRVSVKIQKNITEQCYWQGISTTTIEF